MVGHKGIMFVPRQKYRYRIFLSSRLVLGFQRFCTGAADEDKEEKKITVIQHQTNVVQNGENNINLTNNGTMNFNF